MRAKRFVYTALMALGFIYQLSGQDTLFYENFDSSPGAKPEGWTTELESGSSAWQFVDGGGTKSPDIPGSRKPPSAYSGNVNALYFFESLEGNEVVLVTPPINLEFGIRPELRFMHAQQEGNLGFGFFHDELRIYYKTHFDSTWTEVRKIAEYTDEVYDWTEQTVILPEAAFVPECYFAFRAKTNYGWGVGIDDVVVVETEVQPRQVASIDIFQEETDMLPTGSKDNQLLRINISVEGNSGSISLNSLDLSSLNTSDTDIETDGVKLYYNSDNRNFFAATLLQSASFMSGEAQFSTLNLELPTGHTSLWVSYDIKTDAVHNNLADAMLQAGSINIGGSTYPASDASPVGNRLIQKAVFYDDFYANTGWILAGDFQRSRPRGLGGLSLGNPDPVFASGDTMVLGNDLSGLGSIPGDYEPNISKYGNLATSPAFDLFYYNDVKLNFLRWVNVANNDTASIELSHDGGSSWNEIWSNNNNVYADGEWKNTTVDLPQAHRQSQVQVRFNLGPTTLTDHLSGWNIENLAITGNYVEYDVGPVALLSPLTGCGHSSAETVRIRVENFGPGATPDEIPVRYSFDGGSTYTNDILNGSIAFEGYTDFDFSDLIDLSIPGVYNVVLETRLDVDEETGNNIWDTVLYVDPTYNLPYEQSFENGNDFWRAEGINPTFELGVPLGSVIHTTASGVNAWVTNLDGVYSNNEDSYLTGPCFDFMGIDYPVFECQLYLNTESTDDGVNLEYSLDNGQSWARVGNLGDGDVYGWNWYNSDAITALPGGDGWTNPEDSWHTARILLDTTIFRNAPGVKFRFHFASDATGAYEGIGIDDIRIYGNPRDVGVVSIESPIDGCAQDIGGFVTVTIMNFGKDTLMAGETLIVGYDLESEATVIDTFVLASNLMSGSSIPYVFTSALEVSSAGTLTIEAFTLLEEDIDFYNETVTNDTTAKSFEVTETPYVFLPSEIFTVRPDTIILNAYTGDPTNTYLWHDASTDPQFNVSVMADGVYSVIASNSYCDYSDTTHVYLLIADVGVINIINPVTSCELGATVTPGIEVRNFGTDTLHMGDQIPVRYSIDGGTLVQEIAVMTADVLPDSTFEYTFATASDMSGIGIYDLLAYTDLSFDDQPGNDPLSVTIEVYGITPIELGPDMAVRAFEYTIDAGAGYDSYLWQDGSSSQTLQVDSTGWYKVTVQQGSLCENSDSLLVTFVIQDIGIERLFNPTDGCGYSATEHVEFYVLNVGTDTLHANDSIFITYRLDGASMEYDTLFVDRLVVPEDSILFSSVGTIDISSIGTYQISLDVSFTKDLVPGNNSLDVMITNFSFPQPELGGVNDTLGTSLPFTLDAGAGYNSYLWNGVAGGQTYDATTYGWYTVEVMAQGGCSGTDSIYLMPSTGIMDPVLPGELLVYPVPSEFYLNIEYRYQEAETLILEIFDSSGRKILEKQFSNVTEIVETIDVTGISQGIYYLRLHATDRQLLRQIVIL